MCFAKQFCVQNWYLSIAIFKIEQNKLFEIRVQILMSTNDE